MAKIYKRYCVLGLCFWFVVCAGLAQAEAAAGLGTKAVTGKDNMQPNSKRSFLNALLALPGLSRAAVSPNGAWVSWTWFRTAPVGEVYLAPTDGSAAPIRMTRGSQDTMLVGWSMDSKSLLVSQDKDGDERDQLFRLDINKPMQMVALTEPHPHYFLSGGDLSPDGRFLVYGANYDFAAGKEIEPTWVYKHDLKTGTRKVLARPEKAGAGVPELNPQGTLILYSRMDLDPSGQQIWLVDSNGGNDREILNFGAKVKVDASWFPDGRRILFLAEKKSYKRLGVYDTSDGKMRWLIDNPKRNLEGAFVPFGSDRAVVLEVVNARVRASFLDPASGLESFLPEVSGNLIPLAPTAGGLWVGEYYSSTEPANLISFLPADLNQGKITALTDLWKRTSLRPQDLTPARELSWKSRDGMVIHGWFYPARQPLGTIVLVHGGPTAHSEDALDIEIQYYVSRGFNVLDPNYRGSTGYNLEFQEAIKKDGWGGAEQDDIRAGIEKLIAEGLALPGKVAITGTSYGGYSSWWAITHFPTEIVAAAAPICGMTDLVVDYNTTRPDLRPYSEEMMGGSPASVPERYRQRSPINYLGDIKGKLLIVQGGRDPNVTPKNVSEARKVLDSHGIKYSVLSFGDEGHGISKVKNQRRLYEKIADFFQAAFTAD